METIENHERKVLAAHIKLHADMLCSDSVYEFTMTVRWGALQPTCKVSEQ